LSEVKLTTRQLLLGKFPPEQCVLIREVSDASGHSRSRSLDYMAIQLWNSRGLSVTGIEQKSNRGDWLKELKQPAKQENHFKHCDYFYLLTDKEGVAKLEEIPPTWGWYHCKNSKIITMKEAPKLSPLPIERSLMCAMLRRAADKTGYVHSEDIESRILSRIEMALKQQSYEGKNAISELKKLSEIVKKFEDESGIKISDRWEYNWSNKISIGNALKLVMNGTVDTLYKQLQNLENRSQEITKAIKLNLESFDEKIGD